MIESGIVEPPNAPWTSPIMLLRKPDDTWRFCVYYRKLNKTTKEDVYSLPKLEDTLSRLEGALYFSVMDLQSGFE